MVLNVSSSKILSLSKHNMKALKRFIIKWLIGDDIAFLLRNPKHEPVLSKEEKEKLYIRFGYMAEKLLESNEWEVYSKFRDESRRRIEKSVARGIIKDRMRERLIGRYECFGDIDAFMRRMIRKKDDFESQKAEKQDNPKEDE